MRRLHLKVLWASDVIFRIPCFVWFGLCEK
jgi:hypothetical protein